MISHPSASSLVRVSPSMAGVSAALSLPALIQRNLIDSEVLGSYLKHAQPQDLMFALHHAWGGPQTASIKVFAAEIASVRTATIGAEPTRQDALLFREKVSDHVISFAGFSIQASL